MAITVFSIEPNTLLRAIKKAIDDKEIDTWAYDSDGDFYHTPEQWKGVAWLRPNAQQGVLTFGLLGQRDVTMTKTVYGIYHGRFIEMLLVHFDEKFSNASATAMPAEFDNFKTRAL